MEKGNKNKIGKEGIDCKENISKDKNKLKIIQSISSRSLVVDIKINYRPLNDIKNDKFLKSFKKGLFKKRELILTEESGSLMQSLYFKNYWEEFKKGCAGRKLKKVREKIIKKENVNKNNIQLKEKLVLSISDSLYRSKKRKNNPIQSLKYFKVNFKNKTFSRAFASFAILMIVGGMYFQFSQTANGAQFTFDQTQWNATPTGANANHASNQNGFTDYTSKSANVSLTGGSGPYNSATLGATAGTPITQTDDGITNTGFNLTGKSFNQTTVSGSNSAASVQLSPESGGWSVASNVSSGLDKFVTSAVDSSGVYLAGYDSTQTNTEWRIEKRSKTDGSLMSAFGTSGVITVNPGSYDDRITSITIDSSYLYVAGYQTVSPGGNDGECDFAEDIQWRIEKRDLTTGALVSAFGTNGVLAINPTGAGDQPAAIKVDSSGIYIAGISSEHGIYDYCYSTGPIWRIEKRNLNTGAVIAGFGTNGVVTEDLGTNVQYISSMDIDSSNMYLVGNYKQNDRDWYIEKRSLTNGALDAGFGTGGKITENLSALADEATSIKVYGSDLYLLGYRLQAGTGLGILRIEKRNASNGVSNSNFGTGGVAETSDLNNYLPDKLDVDSSGLIATYTNDYPYYWYAQKRDLNTGNLINGFGTNGVLLVHFSTYEAPLSISIDSNTNSFFWAGYDSVDSLLANAEERVEKRGLSNGSTSSTYYASGSFISGVMDTGQNNASWGNLSWSASGTGTITLKARSCDDAACSAAGTVNEATAKDWSSVCTNITSGQALSTGGCMTNGDRYIQYQAALSGDTTATPSLDDVTIGYSYFPGLATGTANVNFTTEGEYTQEDADNGTDFSGGTALLHAANLNPTGGTITYTDSSGLNPRSNPAYAGGYTVHTFTSGSDTLNVNASGNVDYLVAAGGGGGGGQSNQGGGGAGGGGVLTGTTSLTTGEKTVTVGPGAATEGADGSNSVFDSLTAIGGGRGGGAVAGQEAHDGGSGGGARSATSTIGIGYSGPPRQGYDGAIGATSGGSKSGGGGGGASHAGYVAADYSHGGNGGEGLSSSLSGTAVVYGSGGGGGNNNTVGSGGTGGTNAGNGAVGAGTAATGTANTGGGGGGGYHGGHGGSGIVIVRYLTDTAFLSYPTSQAYYVTTANSSQINTSTYGHITGVSLTQTTPTNTSLKYFVSFDGRNTWKYWNGSSWQTSTLSDANLQASGMTKATIEGLSQANWESSGGFIAGSGTLDFAADLATTDGLVTPSIDNIAVNYISLPDSIVSSWYNTQDSTNTLSKVIWDENSSLTAGTNVQLQVQTAPDSSSSPGTASGFQGPDGTSATYYSSADVTDCSKSTQTVTCIVPGIITTGDGSDDQWIQYKVYLTPISSVAPQLDDAKLTYTVNAAPTVTNVTASENSSGSIAIGYDLADLDSSSATVSFGLNLGATLSDNPLTAGATTVNLSGTYSSLPTGVQTIQLDQEQITCTSRSGAVLSSCTRAVNNTRAASHTQNSIVWFVSGAANISGHAGAGITLGTGKSATWNIKNDLGTNIYLASVTLRVMANDGQGANMMSLATGAVSSGFELDTISPASSSISINAGATNTNIYNVTLALSATDDSDITQGKMLVSNYADFSTDASHGTNYNADSGTEINYATSKSWVLPANDGNKTVYVKFKDKYGNNSTTSSSIYKDSPPTVAVTSVSQISNSADANFGKVVIGYDLTDSEASTPTTVSLKYCSANCASSGSETWTSAATTSGGSNIGSVLPGSGKQIVWIAKTDYNGQYATDMKIQVNVDDGNTGHENTSSSNSSAFTFDTKNPIESSFSIDNTTHQLIIALPTENSSYKVNFSNSQGVFPEENYIDYQSPYTYAGITEDPATVYMRVRDAYGNYTDVSGKTPAKPGGLSFYDISNNSTLEYREFLTWGAIPLAQVGDGFLHYNILRKTDTGNFEEKDQVDDRARNYYLDPNLDTTKTYTYKINAEDIHGNISDYTNAVSDEPNGTGSSDHTAPSISNVAVSNINTTHAKITWTTDEVSRSSVGYSLVDSETPYLPELGNSSMVLNHEITLTGLTPGQTYNFRVISTDIIGNIGQADANSPDGNDPNIFHFETHPGPAISNVTVPNISNNQATISWLTTTDSNSYVGFSSSVEDDGSLTEPVRVIGVDNLAGGSAPYLHSVTIDGLTTGTTYYFYVRSVDAPPSSNEAIDNNGDNYYQLVTTVDNNPPVISELSIEASVVSNTQAAIHWVTDEPASSKVEYSTEEDGTYTDSAEVDLLDTSHYVILSGLDPHATYYYRVVSHDINGLESTSSPHEFDTQNNPEFIHAALSSISTPPDPPTFLSDEKAVIDFMTDQAAICTIEFRTENGSYGVEVPVIETDYNLTHSMHLAGLVFSTKYYYQITCQDNLGTTVPSETEYSFTTLEKQYSQTDVDGIAGGSDTTTPVISSISAGTITGESATITWTTDELANGVISYGIVSGTYENAAGDYLVNSDQINYVTDHTVIINNLIPATTYYYIALSLDAAGNVGTSSEESFTTSSPSTLSSINIASTAIGQALVTWTTSTKLTSIVEYGTTNLYGSTKSDNTSATAHSVSLSGLQQGTLYHFRVKGEDSLKNLYSSGDYTFQPKSPPKVSTASIGSITEHEASVSVTTDFPTDILVTYTDVKDSANSGSQGKPDLATQHFLDLKNLVSGTTYSYIIKVRDEQGNETTSTAATFTTEKDETPPEISQVKTDNALAQNDKVQTIISWTTNEPATTSFIYKEGLSGEERELLVSDAFTQNHIVVSTVFKAGTVYHFKTKSVDQSGNESVSSDFALLTPRKKENIVQIIVNNFQDIFGWANIGK